MNSRISRWACCSCLDSTGARDQDTTLCADARLVHTRHWDVDPRHSSV